MYANAQFFMKLAGERARYRLASLELATREFPPTLIGLTGGSLTQQNAPVNIADHTHGHVELRCLGQGTAGIVDRSDQDAPCSEPSARDGLRSCSMAWRPAQSRAN